MRNLVPEFILDQYQSKKYSGSFEAIVFFIDISGFSNMTDKLSKHGKIGAELIAEAINASFSPPISFVHQNGGFITHFSGDAFTAVFYYDDQTRQNAVSAALNTSTAILDHFKNHGKIVTKVDTFILSVKIGVSAGTVHWGILKNKLQNTYFFCGTPLNNTSECEKRSSKNEILFDQCLMNNLDTDKCKFEQIETGFYRLLSHNLISEKPIVFKQTNNSLTTKFFPKIIYTQKQTGEYRKFISCFFNFEPFNPNDVKELKEFALFYNKIITLVHANHGYLNRLSFGDKGSFLLIFFGMPHSIEKSFYHACNFAIAAQNLNLRKTRIGLSYGIGYAGFSGSEERCEFTGLSRKVNLAARLMSAAPDNEIYTDHDIFNSEKTRFEFISKGAKSVKGFDDPIKIYQLKSTNVTENKENLSICFGREYELKLMQDQYKKAFKHGNNFEMLIYGEAGIGKTTLVQSFLCDLEQIKYYTISCRDQNCNGPKCVLDIIEKILNLALEPQGEISSHRFSAIYEKFLSRSSLKEQLQNYKSIIAGYLEIEQDDKSLFSQLSFNEKQDALLYALYYLLKSESSKVPLFIFLDDYHNLDSESEEILGRLKSIIHNSTIYFIYGVREKEILDNSSLSFNILKIHIAGLNLNTVKLLIEKTLTSFITSNTQSLSDIALLVFNKTKGNPLFIQSIINNLNSSEKPLLDYKDISKLITHNIPPDIESALLHRFDKLPENLKDIVKTSAVIGLEFYLQIIHSSFKSKSSHTAIKNLVKKHHIWQNINRFIAKFHDELFRESVYDMILKKDLEGIHHLIAKTIIKTFKSSGKNNSDIAYHYLNASKYNDAISYYTSAGDIYQKQQLYLNAATLYNKSADIIKSNPNLSSEINIVSILEKSAAMYLECGRYKKAEDLYAQIISVIDQEKDNISKAKIYKDYASVKFKIGDFTLSLELLNTSEFFILNDNNEDALILMSFIYNIRGVIYGKIGDFVLQNEFLNKSLSIRKEILGENHYLTAESYSSLGYMYGDLGEFEKQLSYYQNAKKVFIKALGKKHPYIAMIYNSIGFSYGEMGKYKSQLTVYNKSLKLRLDLFGEMHPDSATVYNSLSFCLMKCGDFSKALDFAQKGLKIRKELLESENPAISTSLLNIANIYIDLAMPAKAKIYNREALKIIQTKLKPGHNFFAIYYTLQGRIYLVENDFKQAVKYFLKALEIYTENKQSNKVLSALLYLVITHSKLGDYKKSKEYYDKVIIQSTLIKFNTFIDLQLLAKIEVLQLPSDTLASNQQHKSISNLYRRVISQSHQKNNYEIYLLALPYYSCYLKKRNLLELAIDIDSEYSRVCSKFCLNE